MSDTATPADVEDVLSSIRRLVAEGDRSRTLARTRSSAPAPAEPCAPAGSSTGPSVAPTGPAAMRGAPAGPGASADRFVLTPALRVAADDAGAAGRGGAEGDMAPPPAEEAPFIDTDAVPPEDEGAATPPPLAIYPGPQRGTAPVSAATAAPEAGPALSRQADPHPSLAGAQADPEADAHPAPAAAQAEPPAQADAPKPLFRDLSSLEATIAELEAAVTLRPDDWEPDGSEDSPVLGWHATVPSAPQVVPPGSGVLRPFPAPRTGSRLSLVAADEPPLFQHRRAAPEGATTGPVGGATDLAAAALWRKAPAQARPDAPQAPGGAGAEPPVAGPSAAAAERPEATGEGPAPAAEAGPHDPAGLPEAQRAAPTEAEATAAAQEVPDLTDEDEAALRAIIAEVLREELRGPLGEGVTRNLRKMIRREIYRVLATQNLD